MAWVTGDNILYKKTCCLILIALLATSCGYKPQLGPPWMQKLFKEGPDGPEEFRQGWRDGCETGLSAVANRFQRSFYQFKQDYKLAQNPVYYAGWRTSFTYCQRYLFQYLRRNLI